MYLNMFKRDLKDQKGLNAVLFVFMIAAAVAMVTGITLVYSLLVGQDKTYEMCNSTDFVGIIDQDMTDKEGFRQEFYDKYMSYPYSTELYRREVVVLPAASVMVTDDDGKRVDAPFRHYVVTSMPRQFNIPYTLKGERFEVPNGCIAISQNTSSRMSLNVGDTIVLVTQMGHAYEFTVCEVYRDPVTVAQDFMILSDRDCEIFYADCPMKSDLVEGNADPGDADYVDTLSIMGNDLYMIYQDRGIDLNGGKIALISNEGILSIIISFSIIVVAFFIMAMVMTTIDFSLKSAIKREEKQIGMMKAIGVWSFSYKMLFIVKYVIFALIGGIVSLPVGFIISEKIYDNFVYHIIFPETSHMIIMSVLAVFINILCVVIFSLFSLRRMNKITVIDAIHGENRGERFSKIKGLSLSSTKKMNIPFFLAVSDILRGLKRYIYLILAYVLGIAAVLFIVQIKDTLLSQYYATHFFQQGKLDFAFEIKDEYRSKLSEQTGSYKGMIDAINKIFEDNDIPAKIETLESSNGVISFNGQEQVAAMVWNQADNSEVDYLSGGNPPKLYNEIAVSWYRANEMGIKIGDTVTLTYDRFSDDHTTVSEVSEDFIVTAYTDVQGNGSFECLMGDDFYGAVANGYCGVYSTVIDVPDSQRPEVIKKIREVFPEDQISFCFGDEVWEDMLTGFAEILDLMIIVAAVAAGAVLILLTTLYENIFIEEEKADIALLKSMGFMTKSIRLWHLIRLMLLAAVSYLGALVFVKTIGNVIAAKIYMAICKTHEFILQTDVMHNFVITPVVVILGLGTVIYLVTGLTKNISILKVRDE